jgi:hypothetical protein
MSYPYRILDNLRVEIQFPDGKWERMGQVRHDQLYDHLGIKHKLPDEGFGERYVGNVVIWCVPKIPGVHQDAKRIWCYCPDCGKKFTFGKLQQHRKVHR